MTPYWSTPAGAEIIAKRKDALHALRKHAGYDDANSIMGMRCAGALYDDEALVQQVTLQTLQAGTAVLQTHLLADTEDEHVAKLLQMLDPPKGAIILDAGCGVGAVADKMHKLRPDLVFFLQNRSPSQLALAPAHFTHILGDFQDVGLPAGSIDVMMFSYSLGHGHLEKTLWEAQRLLRPGGLLFIYDMTGADNSTLLVTTGYTTHGTQRLRTAARRARMTLDSMVYPSGTVTTAFEALVHPDDYALLFKPLHPVAYRFWRDVGKVAPEVAP